jgi:hypothetical protein
MSRIALFVLSIACVACSAEPEPQALGAAAEGPAGAPGPSPGRPAEAAPPAELPENLRVLARIAPPDEPQPVADEYTRMFYEGELEQLFAKFSSEMKATIPLAQLELHQARFVGQFGKEREVVHRESKNEEGYRAFVRWARFEKADGLVGIQWILSEDDSIAGFYVRQAPEPSR